MHLVGILRPQCVMLENVPSLKDKPKDPKALSNFEAVRKAFHDESYVFASKVFCARDVGMPVRRSRLYMVVVHANSDVDAESAEGVMEARIEEVMADIQHNIKHYELDAFLLPNYKGLYVDWFGGDLEEHGAKPRSRGTIKQHITKVKKWMSKAKKWRDLHTQCWRDIAFRDDKILYMEMLSGNPFFEVLSERAQDNLVMQLCNKPFPGDSEDVFGLEASANRVPRGTHIMPCILPRSCLWIAKKGRPLLGIEGLMLQGADISALSTHGTLRPHRWSNTLLMDLAGNAFCVPQFVSWFVTVLTLL